MRIFHGQRLVQAREARGMSAVALSELVGVTPSAISQYENKDQTPRMEIVERLANKLNVPVNFFFRATEDRAEPRIFYRSMSAATKSARRRAERRYEWLREIVLYLSDYFEFPPVDLPEVEVPSDFRRIDKFTIETAASQTREYWNLGVGPITNMVRTLESHGVFVARSALEAETLDAFSEVDDHYVPYVFLGADKANAVRSRFDAAHELGHMVLHKNVDRKSINRKADFRLLEDQAHHFAGAFLLPAVEFSKEQWAISLDCFRSLKPRWKTSIAAMVSRCEQLELVSATQAKRLWINRSRRGWRQVEPLDDVIEPEQPTLLAQSIKMLVEKNIAGTQQIVEALQLSSFDIEELAGLPRGYLSQTDNLGASPKLKNDDSPPNGNVITFPLRGRT